MGRSGDGERNILWGWPKLLKKHSHLCRYVTYHNLCTSQIEASTYLPRATPRAFEFLENFCSNSPLTGPKAVQMPPPPGKSPDYCFNFSVASIYASEAVHVNMVY